MSAWGKSWGNAWGNAWGEIVAPVSAAATHIPYLPNFVTRQLAMRRNNGLTGGLR